MDLTSNSYADGLDQVAPSKALVSEIGSLSLEFTRLSQLTGDPKYYDAIQRVADELEKEQEKTTLPGMWPITVDMQTPSFKEDTTFTLGGMSDSLYEYFPKQYLILGGLLTQPKTLYEKFIGVAKERLFFRIYNPENKPLTISGGANIRRGGEIVRTPRTEHLTCFVGGMVGLASRVFDRPDELALAEELTNGCVWAYDSNVNGIGPEIFTPMPCPMDGDCKWSDEVWYEQISHNTLFKTKDGKDAASSLAKHAQEVIEERRLTPGLVAVLDARYILRPEAIESVFIMYRITGDRKWQDTAWRMFEHVKKATNAEFGAAAIGDITVAPEKIPAQQMDSMESFWLAETLKYYYLCFEDFDKVSLDEYVLNTEAHPLKRPR
jgi:mannosyl-oligosaccharide alpha-1,2-mannosidase